MVNTWSSFPQMDTVSSMGMNHDKLVDEQTDKREWEREKEKCHCGLILMWGGCTRKKKYKPRSTTVNSIVSSFLSRPFIMNFLSLLKWVNTRIQTLIRYSNALNNSRKTWEKREWCRFTMGFSLKEQLFSTYLFDDKNKGDLEVHILAHMNENLSDVRIIPNWDQRSLSQVFNCRLQSLKERDIAIVAVHAFYRYFRNISCDNPIHLRSNKLNDEWSKCTFPLFTGLLVCYILR